MEDAILFCGRDRLEYPWMSNFYIHKMNYDDKVWRSVEHLYQALKFHDEALREEVRKLKTPKETKVLANDVLRQYIREDWHDIKVYVMQSAVALKFEDAELRAKLLATGDKKLIEHSPWDSFWGSGKDMQGQNWMGRILMELRKDLQC
jgi:ribA/ribD-fused uncharacterized protein